MRSSGHLETRARAIEAVDRAATVVAVIAAMIASVATSRAADPLPGSAVRVSPAAGNQVETSIAVNPTNPLNIVAGYIDSARCGVAATVDGGITWTTDILAESTQAPFTNAGDPVVDFAADGTAYYLCMNTANSNAQKSQYVYRSTDGGTTWNDGSPTLAITPTFADHDKGHIVVDNSPASPFFGNVYVAATNLATGQVLFARSTDGATSFSAPIAVNDTQIGFAVNLAVGADGAVYAIWQAEQTVGNSVAVRVDRSDDGGLSFGALTGGIDHVVRNTGVTLGGVRPVPGRGNGFPYVDTHPTDPNVVYALWAEPAAGDDSDVIFSRSIDRGNTWSPPFQVNIDINPVGDFSSQFWPTMAVDPVDGDINIIWYSDQDDPDRADGTPLIDLYFTRSPDDGLSFDAPVRVTAASSTPSGFFGDYLGIDAFAGVAHPLWVDTTLSGTFDAATTQIGGADLAIAVTDFPDPAVAGQILTYDVTVVNAGPAQARDVVVTEQLPPGTTFVSSTQPCAPVAGSLECALPETMNAGDSASIQLAVTIDPALVHDAVGPVTITNTVSVRSSQPDPVAPNNVASETTTVVAVTDLAVTSLTAVGPPLDPVLGEAATWDLTAAVTNLGPSGPVDGLVQFGATATSGLSVVVPAAPVPVASLGVGSEIGVAQSATVTCNGPGSHTVTFTATATPNEPSTIDPDPVNSTATRSLTLTCLVPVAINIKPGSAVNPVNPASRGVITVALLTTTSGEYGLPVAFDATAADVDTIRFGPIDVLQAGGGAEERHSRGHVEDGLELDEATRDGDLDLTLHFATQDSGVTGGVGELCLRGSFEQAGQTVGFVGCDQIEVQG